MVFKCDVYLAALTEVLLARIHNHFLDECSVHFSAHIITVTIVT